MTTSGRCIRSRSVTSSAPPASPERGDLGYLIDATELTAVQVVHHLAFRDALREGCVTGGAALPPSAGRTAEHNRVLPTLAGAHQRLPQSATVGATQVGETILLQHQPRTPQVRRSYARPSATAPGSRSPAPSAGRPVEHNRVLPTPAGTGGQFPRQVTVYSAHSVAHPRALPESLNH